MSMSVRKYIAAACALLLGITMAAGMVDMPAAGEAVASYGLLLTELAITERNTFNTVSGVLFDLRALDTLGELLILYTASAGLHIVLLRLPGEKVRQKPLVSGKGRPRVPVSDAIRTMCFALATPVAIYGIYICLRGHLTVGGGFQGGVVFASALILLYLAGHYNIQKKVAGDEFLDLAESAGMGGVVILGLIGLFLGGSLFMNILSPGEAGDLISGGMIPLLSILVGIESAAAVIMIISHLQRQPLKRITP